MLLLFLIAGISVWILLQVGAELLGRWVDKKALEHQINKEKNYGRRKTQELDSTRPRHKD